MSSILCRCGTALPTDGLIPNPIQYQVMSDELFDEFSGLVDAEVIYRAATIMLRCPICGRLWIYWDGFEHDPYCYLPEPGDD